MTSMGEMSAARTTIDRGRVEEEEVDVAGDFRSAFWTSLTPRLRVLCFAAEGFVG